MTSGLAERKERRFGTRRTPNTHYSTHKLEKRATVRRGRKERVGRLSAGRPFSFSFSWCPPFRADSLRDERNQIHTQDHRNHEFSQVLTFPGLSFLPPFHGKISWSFVLAERSYGKLFPSAKVTGERFSNFCLEICQMCFLPSVVFF